MREEIATAATAAGRDPGEVEVLAATKYVSVDDLPVLAEAGVGLVGENRAQDLAAKVAAHGEMFTWDFIGRLQSRKVKAIVPHVRLIHSVASESVLARAGSSSGRCPPGPGDPDRGERRLRARQGGSRPGGSRRVHRARAHPRGGIDDDAARSPGIRRTVAAGLRRLRALADERGLARLSMGTSQDYRVAVQEGATIVRIGTRLYD